MTGIERIDWMVQRLGEHCERALAWLARRKPTPEEAARIRPFIVLCSPRTGSTHLLEMLRQHPAIEAYFEVLHDDTATRDRIDGKPAGDEEPGEELLLRLFGRQRDPAVAAVGFKLMYAHARKGPLAAVWEHLAADPRLLVIDLYRRNFFEILVSHRLAERTNVWQAPGRTGGRAGGQVVLSAHDCANYFETLRQQRSEALERFGQQEILTMAYEDLIARPDQELGRIWNALGLPPFDAVPVKRKFETLTMEQRVANYPALRELFADTPDAPHFAPPEARH